MRLINADDLKNVFEGYSCTENPNPHFPLDMVKKDIDKAPTVEAVPVVHGEWKMRGGRLYCTNCEKKALEEKDRDDWYGCIGSNFCPNCGADMRKKV